jgi:hypothetical protein
VRRALVVIAIALLVVVGAGALSAGRACAHDPRFACSPRSAANPVVVSDPQKSWAFYGHLAAGQEDRYVIETAKAVAVPVQLLLDQRDDANPARPIATIASVSGRTVATIDLDRAQAFYEPFSQVSYLESAQRLIRLKAGTSTITVTMHGGGAPQRYALAIGSDERFSVFEIPYLLGAVYRIHTRRF